MDFSLQHIMRINHHDTILDGSLACCPHKNSGTAPDNHMELGEKPFTYLSFVYGVLIRLLDLTDIPRNYRVVGWVGNMPPPIAVLM